MFNALVILVSTLFIFGKTQVTTHLKPAPKELASRTISLNDRQPDKWVNGVFKDNILLNLAYLVGKPHSTLVLWDQLEKPSKYEVKLMPNETFAFHDDVLPEYAGKPVKTTNAHFNAQEGFKSDGWLTGDGVCHLASLINWAAQAANLKVLAPTNHNFARIPEIPAQYGVAIYNAPGSHDANAQQNLYVTNTYAKPISLVFEYDGANLKLKVLEVI